MDLREVLADRIERRHRNIGRRDRREQLAALRAGRPVTVSSDQLASALWEQAPRRFVADDVHRIKGRGGQWIVRPDSSFERLAD
jgi:hypothetical protein